MKKENWEHCKSIAETLEKYADGNMYRCPDCGEECELEEIENENGESVYKCACGHVSEYEPEQLSIWDYFNDIYNIEFRIDSNKEYRSAQIMIACGGPNIYIDTASKAVELYWWGNNASYPLHYDAVDAVDDWAADYWACL